MRILLFSLYFHPDPAANSVIMTQLAQHLAAAGHSLTVICAFPHYDTNRIWPVYRKKLLQHESHHGINICRTWLYVPSKKTSMLGRLLNYVSFNVLSTLVGLALPRPDVILAPSPPLSIGLSAWLLGLLRRVPYVYNVQDIYPDIAVRLGTLSSPRVIAFFSWLERFVYRRATAVSVISEGFRRNLLSKGVPEGKIVLIPNFVDTAFMAPRAKDNPFASRHGLVDRFVVLFAGNVGLSQGLEHVLAAAELLADCQDVLFLITGNGSAKPTLERRAAEMCLGNVRFLPFQPREEVPDMYAAADVCLVPLRKGVGFESVPSKALTIMAAGRPIIASVDEGTDAYDLVRDAECGLCTPPEDPAALAGAIRTLYADPALRDRMGRSGRAHVTQRYTPKEVARQYDRLLTRVVEAHRTRHHRR